MSDLQARVSLAAGRLNKGTYSRQPDGIYALRWEADLPGPWSPSHVTLIVLVPPLFPAQAPSGFDVVGTVGLNGAAAGGAGQRPIGEEMCTHFCWNPQSAIPYADEDSIWRFAKFSETRFLALQ